MRAAIYVRCSSQRQADKDLSIPAQLDACRAEAARRGWTVAAEFVDEAESARSDARPSFQNMMRAAKSKTKPFDAILVWKFSRFARSREDSVVYKALLRRHQIELISLNEHTDDSASGQMLEGIIEVMDEFYSRNLAEDTTRGMRKNAERGYQNGGRVPIGYLRESRGSGESPKKVLVPDPGWAPLVRRIFREALDGSGALSIAQGLNQDQLRTKAGRPWTNQRVLYILKNEVYCGTLVWGRHRTGLLKSRSMEPIRNETSHDGLVSRRDWERTQVIIQQRSPTVMHPRAVSGNYLLSGLIYCGLCGARLIGHPAKGGRYHYYTCQTKKKQGGKACASRYLNRDKADTKLVDKLKDAVLNPAHFAELVAMVNEELKSEQLNLNTQLIPVQAQLSQAKQRLERLFDLLETDAMDVELLKPRLEKQRRRVVMLSDQEAMLTSVLKASPPLQEISREALVEEVHSLQDHLSSGSMDERRAFLRAWIRRIDWKDGKLIVTYTFPVWPGSGEQGGPESGWQDPAVNADTLVPVNSLAAWNSAPRAAVARASEEVLATDWYGSRFRTRT